MKWELWGREIAELAVFLGWGKCQEQVELTFTERLVDLIRPAGDPLHVQVRVAAECVGQIDGITCEPAVRIGPGDGKAIVDDTDAMARGRREPGRFVLVNEAKRSHKNAPQSFPDRRAAGRDCRYAGG